MDAILILGAAVWANGPSPTLRRRTLHAAGLWHAGQAPAIIPCGGQRDHPPTEAAAMHALLVENGVDGAQIHCDDQSTNTLENIRNARRLMSLHDVIIVTDAYHAKRAAMVARHFGLNASLSCPPPTRSHLRQHLREMIALPAYAWKLRRTPRED